MEDEKGLTASAVNQAAPAPAGLSLDARQLLLEKKLSVDKAIQRVDQQINDLVEAITERHSERGRLKTLSTALGHDIKLAERLVS